MKKVLLLSLLWLGFANLCQAQGITQPRVSPQAEISQTIGISKITINYSRPQVKDREIWGKIVPYGMVNLGFGPAEKAPWRAGANENTSINFSHDAKVEGKAISAGTYGLHMAVEENGSVMIIFSKNASSWGSYYYDENEDALRVTVQSTENQHVETLTYGFINPKSDEITAVLDWEKKRIPFKISFDVPKIVLSNARDELRSTKGFSWQGPYSAASFCLQNEMNYEEAIQWADQAIGMQKNFTTLSLKAQLLEKTGKASEAEKLMTDALPNATVFEVHGYGRTLIAQGKTEKALEIFKWNYDNHKGEWPVNYGMARAYSAKGDYKTALKYLKKALDLAPAEANKKRVLANIEKLEKGQNIN